MNNIAGFSPEELDSINQLIDMLITIAIVIAIIWLLVTIFVLPKLVNKIFIRFTNLNKKAYTKSLKLLRILLPVQYLSSIPYGFLEYATTEDSILWIWVLAWIIIFYLCGKYIVSNSK